MYIAHPAPADAQFPMEIGGERKKQRLHQQAGAAVAVAGGDLRPWADLPPDLLLLVACGSVGFSLRDYRALRAVCAPWRSAVKPVSPPFSCIAFCPRGPTRFTAAFPLPSQPRTLELGLDLSPGVAPPGAGADRSICLGATRDGWVAVHERFENASPGVVLAHPVSGKKIRLPPWRPEGAVVPPARRSKNSSEILVTKMAFAPSPSEANFAAVAICTYDTLVYAKSGYGWWVELVLADQMEGDMLADVLYHEGDGGFYCLTELGNVRVVRLPEGRRLGPPRVENLLPAARLPFFPTSAAVFARPFCTMNECMNAKNLVLCGGRLHQVWRNSVCTRTSPPLLDGTRCRVLHNDIFVLRYDHGSSPCWNVVKDLGGYSLFVGKNNAVAVLAGEVPGVRPNCVYWIGGRGRDQAMVFDMATRSSAPYIEARRLGRHPQQAICWYFIN